MTSRSLRSWGVAALALLPLGSGAATPVTPHVAPSSIVFREGAVQRPLRYSPDGTDFVITNGPSSFNRPLYGGGTAFRVDAGDRPEFSLYIPGRGGNLRLGVQSGATFRWLSDFSQIVSRYRPGSMRYELRDPLLGTGVLHLAAVASHATDGLIVRAELSGSSAPCELLFVFGGVDGLRGRRDGDLGCEPQPLDELFRLTPARCASNIVVLAGQEAFAVRGAPAVVRGVVSGGATLAVADAASLDQPAILFATAPHAPHRPLVTGRLALSSTAPAFIGLQRIAHPPHADRVMGGFPRNDSPTWWKSAELAAAFDREEAERTAIANRVRVETPDPFVNAAASALNIAADAVWDDRFQSFMHGAVAWRTRLLGWRGTYAGNTLGWHERTATHLEGFARQQNTNAIPAALPAPEESARLSRNENALHSNGDLTRSHYDMNLVAVDAFFRHLLWTGDLEYARRLWPVIERHLAWERRLFRREFGPQRDPLYEAYCCIWASDDLAYNGGGVTHSSAYNAWHHRMAARVAPLIGMNAGDAQAESDRIIAGMRRHLWLGDRGWYAEWKDLLGLGLVHPAAAVWTFYHTVDSEVMSPFEAWQMTRYIDTQIARIPVEGPGVPAGLFTLPTTSWMPYSWSLNNVVMAESMHTALGYWQSGRPDAAFPLFKGALLDSMFQGACPGNVGMCTWLDATRHEGQRDFADGCGTTARAFVEGLFGVQPDLLAGSLTLRPGFPSDWPFARLTHPNVDVRFQHDDARDTYTVTTRFSRPVRLLLHARAARDRIPAVTVNGQAAAWRMDTNSVDVPRLVIEAPAAPTQVVVIAWAGVVPARPPAAVSVKPGAALRVDLAATVRELHDPQRALGEATFETGTIRGRAIGATGHRTVFARVEQGALNWWLPVPFEILPAAPPAPAPDWTTPVTARCETVDLAPWFNDRITRIFQNEYRHPRSPYCSLATPFHGIGSWCHPTDTFEVDDSGLRAAAAASNGSITLPNGIPLKTPGAADAPNVLFVSQWSNYPSFVTVPLQGRSKRAVLLLAGSTTGVQSRFDNGEVIATYTDGTTARLALHNPTTWWPIDRDYYIDDYAFRRPEPLPPRIDLKTGRVRVLRMEEFKGTGRTIPGGAATVLDLPLDPARDLKSLTVRALANEVVIGLLSVTLVR